MSSSPGAESHRPERGATWSAGVGGPQWGEQAGPGWDGPAEERSGGSPGGEPASSGGHVSLSSSLGQAHKVTGGEGGVDGSQPSAGRHLLCSLNGRPDATEDWRPSLRLPWWGACGLLQICNCRVGASLLSLSGNLASPRCEQTWLTFWIFLFGGEVPRVRLKFRMTFRF